MNGYVVHHFLYLNVRRSLRNKLRTKRKALRAATDLFDLSNERFVELFRLPKVLCKEFIEEISPFMKARLLNSGLSKKLRILVALRFFAQGSYQRSVGQDFMLNISQSSVSRCVTEITNILDRYLLTKYVKFPSTPQEIRSTKAKFFEKFHFPAIIGAIDGSHIKIKAPSADIEHVYVCRKGGHYKFASGELNDWTNVKKRSEMCIFLFKVCDFDLKILDCNARFGGTAHDAAVWRASALKVLLENQYENGARNFWLLGDSGYPQLPFLMTPFEDGNLSVAQENYNRHHRKARNCIERCFGVIKSRFRCLLGARELAYDPITAGKIINSCIILHNIMILHGVEITDDIIIDESHDEQLGNAIEQHEQAEAINEEGTAVRQQVVQDYFNF